MAFQYDSKIDLGQIVQAVVFVAAIVSAWTNLTNNDVRHDERINAQSQVVEAVKQDLKELKDGQKEVTNAVNDLKLEIAKGGGNARTK